MKRLGKIVLGVMLGAGATSCGGGAGTATPTSPSAGPPSAAVTITILGVNGSQSFTPNPAGVRLGQTIAWHNSDSVIHHIVQDDEANRSTGGAYDPNAGGGTGGFDSGTTTPGSNSTILTANAVGAIHYHCAIHASMVGALTVSQ